MSATRSKIILCLIFLTTTFAAHCQDTLISKSFAEFKNETSESKIYKKRRNLVIAGNIAVYGGTMAGLYSAWYKNYSKSSFHSFNDFGEWGQMDKFGHIYSAYTESRLSMDVWKWAGLSRKKSIWVGGLSGPAYQTVIEVLDGFSAEWGWSWTDFSANIVGGAMLISQELLWDEQRFQIKTSFHRKVYNDPELNLRSDNLFGKSAAERFLKDYNGQTYWLSSTIKPFFPSSKIPAWLQFSIGTGIEGYFGAFENKAIRNGEIIFDRPDIKRYRQWYLAPDIDLTKIKTNKKGVKTILNILNSVKFPTPALELSNGKLQWKWLQF